MADVSQDPCQPEALTDQHMFDFGLECIGDFTMVEVTGELGFGEGAAQDRARDSDAVP